MCWKLSYWFWNYDNKSWAIIESATIRCATERQSNVQQGHYYGHGCVNLPQGPRILVAYTPYMNTAGAVNTRSFGNAPFDERKCRRMMKRGVQQEMDKGTPGFPPGWTAEQVVSDTLSHWDSEG